MSRVVNCVFMCCDRCSYAKYYASSGHVENAGWEVDFKIPGEHPLDLCPDCSNKWNKLVYEFLYGDKTENTEE